MRVGVAFRVDGPTKRNHKTFRKEFEADWLALARPGDEIELDVDHPAIDVFIVNAVSWSVGYAPAVSIWLEPVTVSKEDFADSDAPFRSIRDYVNYMQEQDWDVSTGL